MVIKAQNVFVYLGIENESELDEKNEILKR